MLGMPSTQGSIYLGCTKAAGACQERNSNVKCEADMLSSHCSRSCGACHAYLTWNGYPTYSQNLNKFIGLGPIAFYIS